jgi:hypothetical protein
MPPGKESLGVPRALERVSLSLNCERCVKGMAGGRRAAECGPVRPILRDKSRNALVITQRVEHAILPLERSQTRDIHSLNP